MGEQPAIQRVRLGQPCLLQAREGFFGDRAFLLHARKAFAAGQADGMADFGQTKIGVILTQQQAVFAAAGHHAVRFVGALGRQIVHEHADIRLIAAQNDGGFALHKARGIDASENALCGGFLVAAGAVDLPGKVHARHGAQGKIGAKLEGIDALVFDSVGETKHARVTQTGNGMQHGELHILRHGGGKPLHIPLDGIQPLRLQKELVAVFIREAHNLIFDGRAVPCARTVDCAGVHRSAMDVFADDAVGFLVGIGEVALRAIFERAIGQKGERRDGFVAGLRFHFAKVDGGFLHAGRCAGFEAAQRNAQFA